MISVVTGTLDRLKFLPGLIENTVDANNQLELVLVDGGSTDGSIEYIEELNHPNIKLVKIGKRSSYPHYMNVGIQNAKYEFICQWNDDVLICSDWQDVIDTIHNKFVNVKELALLFNWKCGEKEDMKDPQWLECRGMRDNGWIIINNAEYSYPAARGEKPNEVCMNYGIYSKSVFRKHGLYNADYMYYCADAEMAMRAFHQGAKFLTCFDIKVCVLPAEKRAIMYNEDVMRYADFCRNKLYHRNTGVEHLNG
jgi:GT2 family glycosyltransferase